MVDWLNAWLAALPVFEKIFWFIAVPFSVLTVIQLIIQLFGMGDYDHSVDVHTDVGAGDLGHHGGLSASGVFTVKNLIIFFAVFGWMGIACAQASFPKLLTILVAFLAGAFAMVLVAWLFYSLYRLGESGTLKLENTIGLSGTVYLTIPPNRSGKGQVQLVVQGAMNEIDAISYEDEDFKTGMKVTVIEVVDQNTVAVTKALTFH